LKFLAVKVGEWESPESKTDSVGVVRVFSPTPEGDRFSPKSDMKIVGQRVYSPILKEKGERRG
jgi:hypothetical protein